MKTDDLILVSIDDHVVEPPDMFLNHVPAKYKADAPVVVTDAHGVDQWVYQGKPTSPRCDRACTTSTSVSAT
jgi:hypothetical protein